jgi:hypothetical protein
MMYCNVGVLMIYGYKHWTLEDVPRCFYVGKGLIGRPESTRNRNHKWRATVKRYGFRVEICIGPVTNEEACAWEIENINLMATFSICHDHDNQNDIGCNFTKGGEGSLGRIVSQEVREKISSAQRGKNSAWYGRTHTAETKQKISRLNTGKVHNANTRAKISTRLNGTTIKDRGQAWKDKISASNSRRKGIKLYRGTHFRKSNSVKNQIVLLCGGPDRCGKSNILHELERREKIPVFKASDEHENFLSSQDRFLMTLRFADFRMADLLYQTGLNVLVDRAYMCEWVYSQYFNRETDMIALRKLDNIYAKMGAKILICTRKSFFGIKDDLDPKLDEIALRQISDLYMEFMKWTKCQTYVLYVDDENLEREVNEIKAFIGV